MSRELFTIECFTREREKEKKETRSECNLAHEFEDLPRPEKEAAKNEAEKRNPENDNGAARGEHITSYFLTWEQFAGDALAVRDNDRR